MYSPGFTGILSSMEVWNRAVVFNCMLMFSVILFLLQKPNTDDKVAVGPWLLALFIFVVCGSGEYVVLEKSPRPRCCVKAMIRRFLKARLT